MLNLYDTDLLRATSRFHSNGRPKSKDIEAEQAWCRNTRLSVSSSFKELIRALKTLAGRAQGSCSRRGPTFPSEKPEIPTQDATAFCQTALDKAA